MLFKTLKTPLVAFFVSRRLSYHPNTQNAIQAVSMRCQTITICDQFPNIKKRTLPPIVRFLIAWTNVNPKCDAIRRFILE